MARSDTEQLVTSLEVRIRNFEKNMARANRTVGTNFTAIERRVDQAGKRMEQNMAGVSAKIASSLKGFGAGLAGGVAAFGFTGITVAAREAALSVASIGDQAKRAGVSARALQELGYVASANRIPIDALVDGLKELSLRADELIQTGAGPAAEAFNRLGFSAADLREKLKDPSALLVEIIGRMEKLDKASRIRVADELFGGTAGERFVELVDKGADGIQKLIGEANSFGLVMDDQMIAKAAEVDRRFNLIASTVGTALKGAIVDAATALSAFIDTFNSVNSQQRSTLEANLAAATRNRDAAQNALGRATFLTRTPLERQIAQSQGEIDRINAELGRRQPITPTTAPAAPVSTLSTTPAKPSTGGGRASGGASSRNSEAEAAKREAEGIAELIAELEREKALIGATDVEREISNALRRAGASATDEQKARISGLVTAIEAETKALDDQKAAQEALKSTASDVLRTIADGIRSGASAGEILGNVLDDLASKLIDMAINKLVENAFGGMGGTGGGAGGFFGAIGQFFGFAKGGIAAHGRPQALPTFARGGISRSAAIFGEAGPEAAVPLPDGRRIPVDLQMAGMPADTGSTNVSSVQNITIAPVVNMNAQGGDQKQNADLAQKTAKAMENSVRAIVAEEFRHARRPGGGFSMR